MTTVHFGRPLGSLPSPIAFGSIPFPRPLSSSIPPLPKPLFPPPLDLGPKVTPRFVTERIREDGKRSVVYGNRLGKDGLIGEPHGHSVMAPDGRIDFARTVGGNILADLKRRQA